MAVTILPFAALWSPNAPPGYGAAGTGARQVAAEDSVAIRRALASAQADLERLRRRTLPWTSASSHPCDVRIGRYCYWLSEEDDAPPADTDPEVVTARAELIARFDSAAAHLPGDPWIAGQRVRYLVEAGEHERAVETVTPCPLSPSWWCDALRGFALHAAHRDDASERAFAEALAAMPEAQRCEWTDLADLLSGALRGRYRRLGCHERDTLQATILWLADPLHAVPGNQLLTEHLSRHTVSRLYRRSHTPSGDRWSRATHEGLIRFGWGVWWERTRQDPFRPDPPSVVTHHQPGSRVYVPTADQVADPYAIEPDDIDLEPHRPSSWHAPGKGLRPTDSLPHHFALFRKGDSAVLVATFAVRDDSVPPTAGVAGALVASRREGTVATARRRFDSPSGALQITAAPAPVLVSLEVEAAGPGRVARARYGQDLSRLHRGGTTLSDLLLLQAEHDLPDDLAEAARATRPPGPVPAGTQVGLYWEIYGLGEDARTLTTTVVLRRRGKGLFRRIAELTPFASDRPPISMTWQSVAPAGRDTVHRAVSVQLPAETASGRYTLRVEIHIDGGRSHVAEREITIR